MIGDVRGLGLMCGMELVRDRETKETYPAEADLGNRLTAGFQANGLHLRGSDNMNVMPPLCVTSGEIDEINSDNGQGVHRSSPRTGISLRKDPMEKARSGT